MKDKAAFALSTEDFINNKDFLFILFDSIYVFQYNLIIGLLLRLKMRGGHFMIDVRITYLKLNNAESLNDLCIIF